MSTEGVCRLQFATYQDRVVGALAALLFASLSWAPLAMAQESEKTWRITDPAGQSAIYNTQQDAVDAFITLPVPDPMYEGAYQYVDKIKEAQIAVNGDGTITYWMGKEQPTDPEWSYVSAGAPPPGVSTEQAAVAALVQFMNSQNPSCPPGATATPTGDWTPVSTDPDMTGRSELKYYATTAVIGDNTQNSPCQSIDFGPSALQRTRRLHCPNVFMQWSDEHQACVNEELTATITTKVEECDAGTGTSGVTMGLVGNPCNLKSGEKYEVESDINLGWIVLDRYYHSGTSSATGGFGPGWTHSHSSRLAIGLASVGLIQPTGFQVRFHQSGSDYWAADSSGDRLVQSGGQWLLYTSDSTMAFDSTGRLVARNAGDGTSLNYAYDQYGRLGTITHSKGRSLAFQYNGTSADAQLASVSSAGITLASYTYTASGIVQTVMYPGGGTRTYHYEDARFPYHLTGITDEKSNRFSTFAYDSKGRVTSSQRAGGAGIVSIAYSSQGGAIVTDALNGQTNYGLTPQDPSGVPRKIGSVNDGAGSQTQTYYGETSDFRRRADTFTDHDGTVTKQQYTETTDSVSGLAVRTYSVTEAYGLPQARTSEERYERSSNRLVMSLIGDRETRYTRNGRHQPISTTVRDTTNGATRTTTYNYCESGDVGTPNGTCPLLGLLKSIDGPRIDVNDVTQYAYYPSDDVSCAGAPSTCPHRKGDLWKTTNALGHITEVLKYDALGRVLSVKDANGVTTDYEYNPRGWPTATKIRGPNTSVETDDRISKVEYEATGSTYRATAPNGSYVQFGYDAAQRLTDVTDNSGNFIHYTLDAAGNRTKEETKDSSGTLRRQLSRVYNALGEQIQHKDGDNHITGSTYDADGNPNLITDPLSRVVDHDHDPLNRVSRIVRNPGGIAAETGYVYDALDNITRVTDPKGLQTNYSYNGFGDLTELNSPDSGLTQYSYDSAGNLSSRLDANDTQAHIYDHDALNRLVSISMLATSGGNDVTYQYDAVNASCAAGENFAQGRLTGSDHFGVQLRYCYNRFGQVVRKTQLVSGRLFTVAYAYTTAGDLQAVTYPDGNVVDYVRDAQGRISEIGVTPTGGGRTVLLNQASYAPFGPALGWVYGNGRSLARSHNRNYQVETIQDGASGGLSLHYGYDAAGQLTELKDGLQSTSLARYDYDNLGRLTILRDGPSGTPIETYTYDATGNRTSLLHGGMTKALTYPSTSHRLSSFDGAPRTYDGVGNTTTINGTSKQFSYGEHGRMDNVAQNGSSLRSYAYNALGERVASIIPGVTGNPDGSGGSPPIPTYSVHDEAGRWLGDYDSNGAPSQQVIWLDGFPVGVLAGTGAGQKLHYVEPDHLGSPRAVIDQARDVAIWAWALKGEAFGNSPPNQDPDLDSTNFVFNLRFPGQRYDPATGLNYNYFRDYDPSVGRYIQSDPIGLNGGVATYGYAGASALSSLDPFGLSPPTPDMPPRRIGEINDGYNDYTRGQYESKYGPFSSAQSKQFDRGCVGAASVYQEKGVNMPEFAPGTKCFSTHAQAEDTARKCGSNVVITKQGVWAGESRIPRPGAIVGKPGRNGDQAFNYIVYLLAEDVYITMNHRIQDEATSGPQLFRVYRGDILGSGPRTSSAYPAQMSCTTCP